MHTVGNITNIKTTQHVAWDASFTDYKAEYLGYDIAVTQGPDESYTLWISLRGATLWGPAMGYLNPEQAFEAAAAAVQRLEAA